MLRFTRPVSRLIAAAAAIAAMPLVAQESSRHGLASTFARAAREMAGSEVPTVPRLRLAVEMMQQAVELRPDDVELQRLLLKIAILAENTDVATRVTADLARLDPTDEWVRLLRLNQAIDRYQAAEDRIDAYQRLLSDENLARLDPAIAGRLALDLALLHYRIGNADEHARWLGTATAIDQSNKPAAAMAAGYFQARTGDAFGQAELFLNLLIADPTDVQNQLTLASHLLNHGAYDGAATLYEMSEACLESDGNFAADDVVADHALAQWGEGNAIAARNLIVARRRQWNRALLNSLRSQRPDLSAGQTLGVHADVPQTMHVVHIAMLDAQGDDAVTSEVESFIVAMEQARQQLDEKAPTAAHMVALLTEAWMLVWFTDKADAAAAILAVAENTSPMSNAAKSKFAGWIALRRNQHDAALRFFEGADQADPAVIAGIAMVHQARGEAREAARRFLSAWRASPGTALGLWSRDMLARTLGHAVPVDDSAAQLNALIAGIPAPVIRLASDPSRFIAMSIEPLKESHRAFEPVVMRLSVTNKASIPIAISDVGPLRPTVIIQPNLTIIGGERINAPPFVIELDRRLRIEPGETLTIDFDLRRHAVGQYLDEAAMRGVTFNLVAILNPKTAVRGGLVVEPGILGLERRSGLVRIDGVNVDRAWFENAIAAISVPDDLSDIEMMPMIATIVARDAQSPTTDAGVRALMNEAAIVLPQAFGRLDPYSQAWVLQAIPRGTPIMESMLHLARQSSEPIVQITYLLTQAQGVDDPMILAAARSENPQVRRFGELILQLTGRAEASGQADTTGDGP